MELTETEGGKSNNTHGAGESSSLWSRKVGRFLDILRMSVIATRTVPAPFLLRNAQISIERILITVLYVGHPRSIHFSTFIIIIWRPAIVLAEPNIAANISRNSSMSTEQFVRSWNKGLPYMETRQSPGNETYLGRAVDADP